MKTWLKKTFALSKQGAKDLSLSVFINTLFNLSLLLPVAVFLLLLKQWIGTLFGNSATALGIWAYISISVAILVVICLFEHISYNVAWVRSFKESAVRRIGLAEKLRKLPLSYFGQKNLSDLTTTILSDCAELERSFSRIIPELLGSILFLIPVTIALFVLDWRMALALLWTLPIAFLLCMLTKNLQESHSRKHKELTLECADKIQECIDNSKDIRTNNMTKSYLEGLDDTLNRMEKQTVIGEFVIGSCVTASQMILKLGIATVVIAGGIFLQNGTLDFMTLLVFLIAASRIFEPISATLSNLASFFISLLQVERVRDITEYPVQNGEERSDFKGYDITFQNVKFSYDNGENVLNDVSFTAKQGEITALVGSSGGGKSTATKLAARFWDINSGKITLGGVDISTIDPESYLKNFAIVFQDVTLFNNTIMENIRIGKENATDEEVKNVAKLACCEEFIAKLPNGYETVIGENGSTLSGGERQRLSIARALLKDAPIVLLDEATASLDPENEREIQLAIARLVQDKTVIMIAHRMRTVTNADKILVLDGGKISEAGTHDELLAKHGLYEKLFTLQQSSVQWQV